MSFLNKNIPILIKNEFQVESNICHTVILQFRKKTFNETPQYSQNTYRKRKAINKRLIQ